MSFSRSHFRNCIFVLSLMNWFKYKPSRSTLNQDLHLILAPSFILSIQVLNSRSSHFLFLGARARFQVFFVKKVCFVVFVLNSVEDKDSRFIISLKFKEKSFRVYRGQWDILIILPKKSVFFWFSLFTIYEGEICVVKSTKRFYCKISVQVPIFFPNVRLA